MWAAVQPTPRPSLTPLLLLAWYVHSWCPVQCIVHLCALCIYALCVSSNALFWSTVQLPCLCLSVFIAGLAACYAHSHKIVCNDGGTSNLSQLNFLARAFSLVTLSVLIGITGSAVQGRQL